MSRKRTKGEAIILQRYAAFERDGADILEQQYGIPFAHHAHASDIISAVIANNAGLLDMHAAYLSPCLRPSSELTHTTDTASSRRPACASFAVVGRRGFR